MATIKQKVAFKEVVKGSTLTKAMQVAKYASTTVKRTNKLTRTKGWQELMAKELPDGLLAERHRELLDKREVTSWHVKEKDENGKEQVVNYTVDQGPEVQAVTKALDMAYKLKGTYAAEKHLNVNVEVEANPEIKELAKQLNALYGGNGEPSDGVESSSLDNQTQD